MIVTRCGFKPPADAVMGLLEHLDFLYLVRRDPNSGIVMPASAKAKYGHHQAAALSYRAWNSGSLSDPGQHATMLAAAARGARNALGQLRDRTITDLNKNKVVP
jgi:hypothetical protein